MWIINKILEALGLKKAEPEQQQPPLKQEQPSQESSTSSEEENQPVQNPQPKSAFDYAFEYTLKNEGGFSDDAFDNGGATKYGITIGDLEKWRKRKLTSADVRQLTLEEAKAIYKSYYWDKQNLDKVDDAAIAVCLYDIGVVCGIYASARFVQEIFGLERGGSIDFNELQALNKTSREYFIPKFSSRTESYFNKICVFNPTQIRFRKGWIARAKRLLTLLKFTDI